MLERPWSAIAYVLCVFFFLCVYWFSLVRSSVTPVYAQTLMDYIITLIINVLTAFAPVCQTRAGAIGAKRKLISCDDLLFQLAETPYHHIPL